MGSVSRHPNGQWRARYRDEAGRQHARHFARKVDAERWLKEVAAAQVTGTYVDPRAGKITFKAWFTHWADGKEWATGTRTAADRALASVTFADVPLAKLTPDHVRAWLRTMRDDGLAPSTRKMRFDYVKMSLRAAVRDRRLSVSPCEGVTAPRVPSDRATTVVPTQGQVAAALDAAPPHFRGFVAVCAYAGLRLGEAAGLRLDDVDWSARELRVVRQLQGQTDAELEVTPPKGGKTRRVHVPDGLLDVLREHVETVGVVEPGGYLFGLYGSPYTRNRATFQWRQLRARVGMEAFTLHDLRHFFASGLIRAGLDVVTVQHELGHALPSITLDVYAHLWAGSDDRARQAAAALMAPPTIHRVRTI